MEAGGASRSRVRIDWVDAGKRNRIGTGTRKAVRGTTEYARIASQRHWSAAMRAPLRSALHQTGSRRIAPKRCAHAPAPWRSLRGRAERHARTIVRYASGAQDHFGLVVRPLLFDESESANRGDADDRSGRQAGVYADAPQVPAAPQYERLDGASGSATVPRDETSYAVAGCSRRRRRDRSEIAVCLTDGRSSVSTSADTGPGSHCKRAPARRDETRAGGPERASEAAEPETLAPARSGNEVRESHCPSRRARPRAAF